MRMIKHAFHDIGSLIRGGDRSKPREVRVDNLRQRLAGSNSGPRPLTSDDLARGIVAGELFLEYQPKLDWRRGRISGAEALVRWKHPTHGILRPNQFIALARHTGLGRRMTDWVVATAAAQAVQWHANNLDLEVAVNISTKDVEDVDLPDRVEQHCRNVGIDPAFLILELPEPGAKCDIAQMTDVLIRLCDKGVKLSIDDFGRCYSSLVQLEKVPLFEVKVDLAFVMKMMSSGDCKVIVETLIDLAHKLGLRSVAEGVEDDNMLKTLIDLGCDGMQGYYISRPIAAGLIPAFVRDFESHTEDGEGSSDQSVRPGTGPAEQDAFDGLDRAAQPVASHLSAAE